MASKRALGLADDLLERTDHLDPFSSAQLSVRTVRTVCLALREEHDLSRELAFSMAKGEPIPGAGPGMPVIEKVVR